MANLETVPPGPQPPAETLASVSYLPSRDIEHPPMPEGVFLPIEGNPFHVKHGLVEVSGQEIQYTGAYPEELKYDGVAITIPGFGGFKQTSRPLRTTLAQEGVATITYGPARDDDYNTADRLLNSQELHTKTVEAIIEDLRDNPYVRSEVPNGGKIDFDRIWLLPHSMGNLAAADFAEEHYSQVEAITSLAGVGHGSPTLKQFLNPLFIPKAALAIRHEVLPYLKSGLVDINAANAYRALHYYAKNPTRTIGEAIACLTTDLRPTYERLGELGVKTAFIAFEHDCLIPVNVQIAENVDQYREVRGTGHLAPMLKSARVVSHAIETLN